MIEKLAKAEMVARSRGGAAMAESIRNWRIVLEGLLVMSHRVIESARSQGILVAKQQACSLEARTRWVYNKLDEYKPISTGYEPILLTLQDAAAKMCRG